MKRLILGPPGTGKTTTLLNVVESYLNHDTPSERIAFLSFTKAATLEAKARVEDRFGKLKVPYFRTLHSLCYELTACRGLMTWRDWKHLGEILGYPVHGGKDNLSVGETIRHVESQARLRMRPLDEVSALLAPEINPYQIKHYAETLALYKEKYAAMDYTDLLEQALKCSPVDVDVMIVDEAQDLTVLQWEVVRRLTPPDAHTYYAGDDDQTIHEWAGASLETFLHIEADERIVLDKSYRLPKAIHKFATDVINKVDNRYTKEWAPRDGEPGSVNVLSMHSLLNLGMGEGEWMVLARNKSSLSNVADLMDRMGYVYSMNGVLCYDETLRMITNWERMRRGEKLDSRQITTIYRKGLGIDKEVMKGRKYGIEDMPTQDVWYDALVMIPHRVSSFVRKALKRGESLNKPRIALSSIHAAKGKECDNVVVLSDVSRASKEEMITNPDSEHRVFYVAATRAKERLFIVTPTQENYYRWHGM